MPFVAKFHPGGGWRWAIAPDNGFSSRGGGNGNALVVDATGRVTVSGAFNSPALRFGTTILSATGPANADGYLPSDAFVAQLDSTGAWRWAVQNTGTGNDFAAASCVDGFGNVTTALTFTGTVAIGSTTLTSTNNKNIAVAQIAPSGAWRWVQRCGAGSGGTTALADDGAGHLHLAGAFTSATADFGSHVLTGNPQTSSTAMGTGFLTRLRAGTLASTSPKFIKDWSVYPNPTRQYVDISGLPPRAVVEVVDALGRIISSSTTPIQGTLRITLPPALPAGLYLVRSGWRCQRLIVK